MQNTRNILVTGGAGYVGSHACKALSKAGYTPVVFDNLKRGHRAAVKWGPLHEGDLRNTDDIRAALLRYKPDAVMHFAALTSVAESMAEERSYTENNIDGTGNLILVMGNLEIKKLVFSSSCAVYGTPEVSPIHENTPLSPVSYYGTTKKASEFLIRDYPGLRSISLRYFNAAGADPKGEIGEAHEPETHLIPLVLRAATAENPIVEIYGTNYETQDGTCVRDYVHVSDLALAHVKALEKLDSAKKGALAYNLGAGHGHSVKQVIAQAEIITGRKILRREMPPREGDAPELVANATRAHKELNWSPQRSDLHTIIQDAWNWHQAR